MDQPQKDDDQERNSGVVDGVQAQDTVDETSAGEQVNDETQSIPVTVVSEATNDADVATEHSSEPSSEGDVPNLEQAEAMVDEASPMAVADELASVESELQAMAVETPEPSVDEGIPVGGESSGSDSDLPVFSAGTDPMEQIQADEQQSTEMLSVVPETSESDAVEAPVTEQSDSTGEPTNADSAESVAVEPMSETVVEEPISQANPENSEAVGMANEAILEREPTRNPGELISDVVTPTAVATAIAQGSSGENAITGTPEASSVLSSQNQPTLASAVPTQQKSKKGLLVAVVVLITLLFGGAAVAAYVMKPESKEAQSTSADSAKSDTEMSAMDKEKANKTDGAVPVQITSAPGETIAAKTLDDYKANCGGGMVTNATDYKGVGPHPLVFFEKGSDDKYAMSVVALKDKTWGADATKVTSGQLAVCVSQKTASEKKLKACPITDPATKVTANIDFYSVTYTVDVYNAKTGAKVSTYDSPSVSTTCPTTATYSKTDPKIFAPYDLASVETLIKDVVTKTVL